MESIVKVFAAPGIDSSVEEQGIRSSGAGFHPAAIPSKATPYDWFSIAPEQLNDTGRLIGNYDATKAPTPDSLRIRRRGITPFPSFPQGRNPNVHANVGGSIDTNAGADSHIAGGRGQAASMVRVNGAKKANEGMKLPILPKQILRGNAVGVPAGGAMLGTGSPAPIQPKMFGFPSIIKVLANPASVTKG